jgi:hypothetical protein
MAKLRRPSKLRMRFVEAYLEERNATKAALRAGYKPSRAGVTGCELMKDPDVRAAIAQAEVAVSEKLEITLESQLKKCQEVVNVCDTYEGPTYLTAKLRAIELQSKHVGLLKDKVELGLDSQFIEQLTEGRKRVLELQGNPPVLDAEVVGEHGGPTGARG